MNDLPCMGAFIYRGKDMLRRIFYASFVMMLLFAVSIASAQRAEKLEISVFLGLKDGSENSDGVTVRFIVEEENEDPVQVFEEHWAEQQWSDEFLVPLNEWGGKTITLNLTTDPGEARNTGWDWILIGDAKIIADDDLVFDIGQAVAGGQAQLSMLLDGEDDETPGLLNGAGCSPDSGAVGGEVKPKSFMQHPPWDGKVGNTISRYQIELPAAVGSQAVEASGKLTTTWGQLKVY